MLREKIKSFVHYLKKDLNHVEQQVFDYHI